MAIDPLTESPWRRGWRDTWSPLASWPLKLVDVVATIIVMGLTTWYWGLATFIVGFICVWMWATFRAAIVQRHEAIAELRKQPTPIPLRNRDELVRAIVEVRISAIQLRNLQEQVEKTIWGGYRPMNTDLVAKNQQAHDRFDHARDELDKESILAGGAYDGLILRELLNFVYLQLFRRDKVPQLDSSEFVNELRDREAKVIRKIDEISGQAAPTEGSQTE